MSPIKKFLLYTTLFMLALAAAFAQEAKNALLIANCDYAKEIGALPNPIPEATELKSALESIGFDVTLIENADLKTMQKELKAFKKKNEEVSGTAFFHYGGHAVQVDGSNYLVPIGTEIEDEDDVQYNCLNVEQLLESMTGEANIVILDSCRNNPFGQGKTRGSSGMRGLAATTGSQNAKKYMIVYSAAAGQTAQDGVFTPILTQKITEKNKTISQILTEVRGEVYKATDGKQATFEYNGLIGNVYLAGVSSTASVQTGSIHIESEVAGVIYLDGMDQKKKIRKNGTIDLNDLPNGEYKLEVRTDTGRSFKQSVKVIAGNTANAVIRSGSLTIISKSSGDVYLNNEKYGYKKRNIDYTISELPEGSYCVEIRSDYDLSVAETISVKSESIYTEIKTGEIELYSEVAGNIYLNGKDLKLSIKADKKVKIPEQLLSGMYTVEVRTSAPVSDGSIIETSFKKQTDVVPNDSKLVVIRKQGDTVSNRKNFAVYTYPLYTCALHLSYGLSRFIPNKTGSGEKFFSSFEGHGMGIGLTPIQIRFNHFEMKLLDVAYSLSYGGENTKEQLYHSFDFPALSIGVDLKKAAFHAGCAFSALWKTDTRLKNLGRPVLGLAVPVDLELRLGERFLLYSEYRPFIAQGILGRPLADSMTSFIKHSFHFGITVNLALAKYQAYKK